MAGRHPWPTTRRNLAVRPPQPGDHEGHHLRVAQNIRRSASTSPPSPAVNRGAAPPCSALRSVDGWGVPRHVASASVLIFLITSALPGDVAQVSSVPTPPRRPSRRCATRSRPSLACSTRVVGRHRRRDFGTSPDRPAGAVPAGASDRSQRWLVLFGLIGSVLIAVLAGHGRSAQRRSWLVSRSARRAGGYGVPVFWGGILGVWCSPCG